MYFWVSRRLHCLCVHLYLLFWMKCPLSQCCGYTQCETDLTRVIQYGPLTRWLVLKEIGIEIGEFGKSGIQSYLMHVLYADERLEPIDKNFQQVTFYNRKHFKSPIVDFTWQYQHDSDSSCTCSWVLPRRQMMQKWKRLVSHWCTSNRWWTD